MERIRKIKEMLAGNPMDSFLCHALALEYIKLGNATVPFLCYNVKFYTNFLQEHGR